MDTSLEPQGPPAEQSSVRPSSRVKPFSRAMIKRYLERADFAYLRDGRNDFRVDFAHDDDISCAPSFWFMAVGKQEEIYGIEGRSTRRFPREMWEWTLFIVNEWNRKMRYPKAYFHVSDSENDRTGEIRLEQYFDLEKGVHQELFDAMSHTIVSGSMRFWSWLHEQFAQYTLMATADEDRLDG